VDLQFARNRSLLGIMGGKKRKSRAGEVFRKVEVGLSGFCSPGSLSDFQIIALHRQLWKASVRWFMVALLTGTLPCGGTQRRLQVLPAAV
jgi:hypothetical protein